MNIKKFITATFIVAMTLTTTAYTTPLAEASCSYNGYYNSKGKCEKSYSNKSSEKKEYKNQYQMRDESIRAMIARLQAMITFLESQLSDNASSTTTDLVVNTKSPSDVNDDSATLRGKVYLGDEDEADVYFKYGTNSSALNEESDSLNFNGDKSSVEFEIEIDGLKAATKYYYRAVAEDNDGNKTYGSIYNFKTAATSSSNDEPEAVTKQTENIDNNSAKIHGVVDMNDFENGLVFFVYGENEDLVKDIEDDYTEYADIDEDNEDLQKVEVDSDLDGNDSYNLDIENLNANTKNYYSICVEFENVDNNQEITCGSTKSFTTAQ